MSRSQTPRAKAPTPDMTPAPEANEGEDAVVLLALRDHPFVVAALALAGAIVTVAKFPNSPVPESLVNRVDAAQAALVAAANDLDQGFFTPELSQLVGEPLDDNWVRKEFASLADALKVKFDELGRASDERFAAIEKRLPPVIAPADPAASEQG